METKIEFRHFRDCEELFPGSVARRQLYYVVCVENTTLTVRFHGDELSGVHTVQQIIETRARAVYADICERRPELRGKPWIITEMMDDPTPTIVWRNVVFDQISTKPTPVVGTKRTLTLYET